MTTTSLTEATTLTSTTETTAFNYVGCYQTSNSFDVFVETTFTDDQCNTAANSISDGNCDTGGNPYNQVWSTSMTVEICIQICITTYGYKYAGLTGR